MSSELMQYVSGSAPVERRDRAVVKGAKRIHDEVRTQAFKADGALALAGHIMEGVAALDNHRRRLGKDDPVMAALLGEIEEEAIGSVRGIQRNLYSGWTL